MFASVIDTLFTALSEAGVMCLRFNFRGVGGSDGRHDHGHGEQLDALAAVEHMVEESPDTAIWAVGWSFGADVALGITHPRLAGWVAVAPPLKVIAPSDMGAATDERPVLLLVPEHDQFNPPERAAETTAGWTATRMVTIAMADHFLNGRLDAVADAAIERIAGLAD